MLVLSARSATLIAADLSTESVNLRPYLDELLLELVHDAGMPVLFRVSCLCCLFGGVRVLTLLGQLRRRQQQRVLDLRRSVGSVSGSLKSRPASCQQPR